MFYRCKLYFAVFFLFSHFTKILYIFAALPCSDALSSSSWSRPSTTLTTSSCQPPSTGRVCLKTVADHELNPLCSLNIQELIFGRAQMTTPMNTQGGGEQLLFR